MTTIYLTYDLEKNKYLLWLCRYGYGFSYCLALKASVRGIFKPLINQLDSFLFTLISFKRNKNKIKI